MSLSFDQKLNYLIHPLNVKEIHNTIWKKNITYFIGNQIQLFRSPHNDTVKHPTLNIYIKNELVEIILKSDGFVFTTFLDYNDDEVFEATDDIFIPYCAGEEMLLQLSTIQDLKWLLPRHVKKFKMIHDLYHLVTQ